MARSDNLFAALSALLLLGGMMLSRVVPNQGITLWKSVNGSPSSLNISPNMPCFGAAAAFALFAFLYSTGYVHIERAFEQWQLWLSAGSIFLFLVGYFSFGAVTHHSGVASNHADLIAGIVLLCSIPLFLLAQALFLFGVVRAMVLR